MQDMYINEAKSTLDALSYRNERAMKFEIFKCKFQNSVNILDSHVRTMHNKDVIDLFQKKLDNAELTMFMASIKVDYRRDRQKYTNIFQEIATHIPTGKTPPFKTAGVGTR